MSKNRNTYLRVIVTQDDIDSAIPRDSSHCVIADSIQRLFPHMRRVSVDLATIRWTDSDDGTRYIALTPRPAQDALLDFDQGKEPAPFSFRLTPAQHTSRKPRSKSGSKTESKTEPKLKTKLLNPVSAGHVPVVESDRMPPVGPLAGGPGVGNIRKGRRREFGLRGIIR